MIKLGVEKEGLTRCTSCGKEAMSVSQDTGLAYCAEHAVVESKRAALDITSLKDSAESLSKRHMAKIG